MPFKNQRILVTYALFFCMFFLSSCFGGMKNSNTLANTDPVQAWVQDLMQKTPAVQSSIASQVWADNSQSMELRNRATFILASRYSAQTSIALSSLASQYQASTIPQKIYMEETLYHDLEDTYKDDLYKILGFITPELEAKFPYSLVIYVAAKRNLLQNSTSIVKTLSSHAFFQSPKVIGRLSKEITKRTGKASIALLLPQSGDIAPIANQIMAGVESARLHLQGMGINWQVYYIDTQNPSWIQQVQDLPDDCVTLGGSLQINDYNTLKINNLLHDRVMFSFLPRLPTPEDEGQIAWQFFTKPEDQINAVLDISSQNLGIYTFGVFSPISPYGKSMEELFIRMANSKGFSTQSAGYPLDDLKAWTKISETFLDSRLEKDEKLPTTHAPFDAIFFPDAWRNMDLLISTMHYHGGHTKIMLGNSLWEQSLNQSQNFNPNTFALTIFPVAYDATQETPINASFKNSITSAGLTPNDWSALGFDFMLMANQLNLTDRERASEINARLSALQLNYVGAPFSWTPQGIASRKLFLSQPARSGRVPLDLAAFMRYRDAGGAIPNKSKSVFTEETLKKQEKQALEKIDSLIDNIMSTSITAPK